MTATLDVLLVPLDGASAEDLGSLEQVLTQAERARFARVQSAGGRAARIVARAAVRLMLAERLGAVPAEIPIEIADGGKPHLGGSRSPAFNVAHSGGLVAAAFADAGEVGVDVEELRERDVDRLTERSLARAETEHVNAADGDERLRRFYDLWTAKEAWLKARGTGISFDLSGFEIDPVSLAVSDPDEPRAGALARLDVPAGYAGAVALIGAALEAPRTTLLPVAELAREACRSR